MRHVYLKPVKQHESKRNNATSPKSVLHVLENDKIKLTKCLS